MPKELDSSEDCVIATFMEITADMIPCEACGYPMVSTDYGYYCCNENCSEYDVDIMASEQ